MPALPIRSLVHFMREITQDSLFHAIQDAEVLHDLQILHFALEQLVGILAGSHRVHHGGRVRHAHLLSHLASSCDRISSYP